MCQENLFQIERIISNLNDKFQPGEKKLTARFFKLKSRRMVKPFVGFIKGLNRILVVQANRTKHRAKSVVVSRRFVFRRDHHEIQQATVTKLRR